MTTAVHINVSDDSSLLTTVYCQAVFNNFYSDINWVTEQVFMFKIAEFYIFKITQFIKSGEMVISSLYEVLVCDLLLWT